MKRFGRALIGAIMIGLVGVLAMTLTVREPAGAQGTTTTLGCPYNPATKTCDQMMSGCQKAGNQVAIRCCIMQTVGGETACCEYANGTGKICYPNGNPTLPCCSPCGPSICFAEGNCGRFNYPDITAHCDTTCGPTYHQCVSE